MNARLHSQGGALGAYPVASLDSAHPYARGGLDELLSPTGLSGNIDVGDEIDVDDVQAVLNVSPEPELIEAHAEHSQQLLFGMSCSDDLRLPPPPSGEGSRRPLSTRLRGVIERFQSGVESADPRAGQNDAITPPTNSEVRMIALVHAICRFQENLLSRDPARSRALAV